MIVDLLDKLLDRCIELIRERKEQHLAICVEFVEPAYQLFQQVHEQYLEHFKQYRQILKEGGHFGVKVEELCDQLKEDNLFTADRRAKVIMLLEFRYDPLFGPYLSSIRNYLSGAMSDIYGMEAVPMEQVFRRSLAAKLREIAAEENVGEEQRQTRALKALDSIVAEIQNGYGTVTREYLLVKSRLIG